MTNASDATASTARRRPTTVGFLCALLFGSLLVAGPACESSKNRAHSYDDESEEESSPSESGSSASDDRPEAPGPEAYRRERLQMVEEQIAGRDVEDPDVLEAMRTVPRHEYVLDRFESRAYDDTPLPIGHDQTISQPYIVAVMTEALEVEPDHRVLEIGTGSGYQAAILGELVDQLYTIEIVCELAERARKTLDRQGYDNVEVKCGDGYEGWPEHAPFDRIIVTAAPPEIPDALVEQLAEGGRMVLPVGERRQELKIVRKTSDGEIETVEMMGVRFVPMVRGEDAGP